MKSKVSLLAALSVLVLGGFYVSRDAPVLAADVTWTYPAVGGCYTAAEGFIVQVEIDGNLSVVDTVMTNHYTYNLPAGSTSRFRVVGFFYDGQGAMQIGRFAASAGTVINDLDLNEFFLQVDDRQTGLLGA